MCTFKRSEGVQLQLQFPDIPHTYIQFRSIFKTRIREFNSLAISKYLI